MIVNDVVKNSCYRIYLRCLMTDDCIQAYADWLNDADVNKYLESRFIKHIISSCKEFVDVINKSQNNVIFGIFLNENNKHIGNIKIGPINFIHKFAEIGYLIGDKCEWNKGYITEAIKLTCEYAFKNLQLNKLQAGTYSKNIGSIKALEKVGFYREGIYKNNYIFNNEYIDGYRYGMLSKNYM